MDAERRTGHRWNRSLLAAVLLVATATRLYQFDGPILDQLHVKQIFCANKARNIARSPRSAVWNSFDFLDARGDRMTLVEEVPLYTGLVGATYALFGEREWMGRAWNILASLIAIVAAYDWLRREYDEETGLIAAFLLATSPLMIFYGRAISPDPGMLACMMLSVASYRRYLDGGERPRWLMATAAFGLLAAAFKYYGLIVLIPLAEMALRQRGWRQVFSPRFLALASALILPIAAWILCVFAQHPNPVSRAPYFVFQAPWVLRTHRFYLRSTLGLFVNDFGPMATLLIALGAAGAARGVVRARPLWGWTAAGLVFVVVFAPKFLDHDYYGLVALPAAVGWAAVGWRCAASALRRRSGMRAWRVAAVLAVTALIQSPWVMLGKFDLERQHAIIAGRLDQLCSPSGKVIVLGQCVGWAVVHYSGREGWVEEYRKLPRDWRERFRTYRSRGAELAALYFDPSVSPRVRQSYRPLLETLPLLDHQAGPWFRHELPCEYYILGLGDVRGAGIDPLAAGPPGFVAAANPGVRLR